MTSRGSQDPEKEFEAMLAIFGNEVNEAMQCFYVWDATHRIARRERRVYDSINRFASFWNVVLRSLQANTLIVLGRIFDSDPRSHNVWRLLNISEKNASIFSKASLERRKRKVGGNVDEWVSEFMATAYVPTASDFQVLRKVIKRSQGLYQRNYAPLRNKFFAHKDLTDVSGLFAATDVRELQRIIVSLSNIHDTLWQLFMNGHRQDLRRGRRSTSSILKLSKNLRRDSHEQEWVVRTTESFLQHLSTAMRLG
jgi:hypothetical protein